MSAGLFDHRAARPGGLGRARSASSLPRPRHVLTTTVGVSAIELALALNSGPRFWPARLCDRRRSMVLRRRLFGLSPDRPGAGVPAQLGCSPASISRTKPAVSSSPAALARRFGVAVARSPGGDDAGAGVQQSRHHVGRHGGDHAAHRLPDLAPSEPPVARGDVEVPDDLLGRDRLRVYRNDASPRHRSRAAAGSGPMRCSGRSSPRRTPISTRR